MTLCVRMCLSKKMFMSIKVRIRTYATYTTLPVGNSAKKGPKMTKNLSHSNLKNMHHMIAIHGILDIGSMGAFFGGHIV